MSKVAVLLSSGLDSQTLMYELLNRGNDVTAIHVLMHTKQAKAQLGRVTNVTAKAHVPLFVMDLSPVQGLFAGSALTDADLPTGRSVEDMANEGINPTYMPLRNTILLALAASYAEGHDIEAVAYGAHASDGVHYADTTPRYYRAIERAIREGSAKRIDVWAPFIRWSKERIIQHAAVLQVPVELSYTCYAGTEPPCGVCDSCIGRIAAFGKAGFQDPTQYAKHVDWGGTPEWPIR